jgi:hypothetical protein
LCQVCGKALGDLSSMRKHHLKRHPTIPTPSSWTEVWIQQFSKGAQREFFVVQYESAATAGGEAVAGPDAATPASRLRSLVQSLIGSSDDEDGNEGDLEVPLSIPNAREVSPWLLSTKWYLKTHNRNPAGLKGQVEVPKRGDPLVGLEDSMRDYFQWATERIPLVDELVLQRLATPEPAK